MGGLVLGMVGFEFLKSDDLVVVLVLFLFTLVFFLGGFVLYGVKTVISIFRIKVR